MKLFQVIRSYSGLLGNSKIYTVIREPVSQDIFSYLQIVTDSFRYSDIPRYSEIFQVIPCEQRTLTCIARNACGGALPEIYNDCTNSVHCWSPARGAEP